MTRPTHFASAVLLASSTLFAQNVGVTDFSASNVEPYGSPTLQARLYFPAKAQQPQRVDTSSGPLPVVVFLAGYSFVGRDYDAFARALAARGYVAVMNETASTDGWRLGEDGKAWYRTLLAEDQRPSSPLHKAIDAARIAIAGHSMGGANVYRVLAEQPLYRLGVALAPLIVPSSYPPLVRRPLCIVAGAGDTITPWSSHAKPAWDAVPTQEGTKIFHLLGSAAHHANVALAGYVGATAVDAEVFASSSRVAVGFLDHYLRGDSTAFDACVGTSATADKHFQRHFTEVREPVLFENGSLQLGQTHEMGTLGAPGISVQLLAASSSEMATPLGTYRLDPFTTFVLHIAQSGSDGIGRFTWTVPKDPGFVGLHLHLQGLCQVPGQQLAFTNAMHLVVRN